MLLSIIVPAYNAERFIEKTLNMLINQGLENTEVIIINDGSKDKTQEIVEQIACGNKAIKLIFQENKGESGARNTGIENSNGDYLYFLDCDDSLKKGSLDFFRKTILENPEKDMYAFGYISTEKGIEKEYSNKNYSSKDFSRNDFIKLYLSKKINTHICSFITSKRLLNRIDVRFMQGLRIGADIDFILRLYPYLATIHYESRNCYIYQIRNDSIMQGYKKYSVDQYHSFEVRRDLCLNSFYQSIELRNYSNFWIENQLLSNIIYYLHSDFYDANITKKLIDDCNLLKRSIAGVKGTKKNKIAIEIAKLLPVKRIIKIRKGKK